MRDRFKSIFKINNIISVHPDTIIDSQRSYIKNTKMGLTTFFYPSLPRVFKNFEVIAEAVKIIRESKDHMFKVILTLDGSENRYAKNIFRKYSHLTEIEFIGLKDREEIFSLYSETDCLLFPSKLESWGLPLSEFKIYNKPIISADLPYAKETLGDYRKVCYFNPDSATDLAHQMQDLLDGKIKYDISEKVELPDANSWKELLDIVIK